MNNTEGLVVYESATEGMLAQADHAAGTIARILSFQKIVQGSLNEGHDYGKIPGTGKPTLLKPGAEKILMILGLGCSYELIDKVEDYSDNAYFDYTVRAIATHSGVIVAEGLGNANTRERRYDRQIRDGKTTAYDLKNTVLKIAEKRAKVDLALHVGALSDLFTQDLEDHAPVSREAEDKVLDDNKPIEARDVKLILALRDEAGLTSADFSERMKTAFGTTVVKELTRKQAKQLKTKLEHLKAEHESQVEVEADGDPVWPGEEQ